MLKGRSILLVAEQGLGDVLQFIRFAPLVKEARACGSGRSRTIDPACGPLPGHRSRDGLEFDFARLRRPRLPDELADDISERRWTASLVSPPCSVDAQTVEDWRPVVARALSQQADCRLDDGKNITRAFTIGITWQGNRGNTVDRWRSFPLTHFAHLARLPGVRLISLQTGDGTEQLGELDGRFPVVELSQGNNGDDPRAIFWTPLR